MNGIDGLVLTLMILNTLFGRGLDAFWDVEEQIFMGWHKGAHMGSQVLQRHLSQCNSMGESLEVQKDNS